MKKIAVIPARYAATRFPGKLMQQLGNKTVIAHTYMATVATQLFDEVVVATDSDVIRADIEQYNGKVVMTRSDHESGTDRIAEAIKSLDVDVVVNVQGDTPFINAGALEKLLLLFNDPDVQVASLMDVIADKEALSDPNVVKVCVDKKMDSLFFSRSVIHIRATQPFRLPITVI
jgi:3-deoxy-manno-octulosonate cytidylyltransferase (CMP-KDO synthetase)